MEITKSNFWDALPIIEESIAECTFLAIDTELTGLHSEQKSHSFDTMEERYVKMCSTAKNFMTIQIGISCFQYHEDTKKYTHKDFNVYVFPRQHHSQVPDKFFTCSASSLNFLTGNGFDFNKLLHEGVSYLTPAQEEHVRAFLTTHYDEKKLALSKKIEEEKNSSPGSPINIPDEHKDFISEIHKLVDEYVASDKKECLSLPPCGAYRRKLIYQTVLPKYPTGVTLSTVQGKNGKMGHLSVNKLTNSEKVQQLEEKEVSDLKDLEEAIGFRRVLDCIYASKKLVLGHNMLLDLFHIVNQFYYPVPQTLTEFKQVLKCVFPRIADTKTLASTGLKAYGLSTGLFELHEEFKIRNFPSPAVEPCDGYECYEADAGKMHEAGYDAFMTGYAFVFLLAKLAEDNKLDHIPVDHNILKRYINRPYIMRHYDIQSLNLDGPDPEGKRDNVFHVSFPKEWKTSDLIELFLPYSDIHVSWLDDVSAFAALKSPEQSYNVKKCLLKDPSSIYKVMTYADYQERHSVLKPAQAAKFMGTTDGEIGLPRKRCRTSNSGVVDGVGSIQCVPSVAKEEKNGDKGMHKQDSCVSTSHHDSSVKSSGNKNSGDLPKSKRQKNVQGEPENHEVSSTEKMFEESDVW